MAMRWLTREWQSGALPSAERESRWNAYLEHRDATAIHLPPALHRLSAQGIEGAITLHHAIPEWWVLERQRALTVALVTGDPGVQTQRVVIQYLGNLEIVGAGTDQLDAWFGRPDGELLYDELEVLPGRRFEQRFLLGPDGEFAVRFDNVQVLAAPVTPAVRDELLARRRRDAEPAAVTPPVPTPAVPPAPADTPTPEPVVATAVAGVPPRATQTVGPAPEAPEGAPAAPPPPHAGALATQHRRSLRELLFSWLPGFRGRA